MILSGIGFVVSGKIDHYFIVYLTVIFWQIANNNISSGSQSAIVLMRDKLSCSGMIRR